MGKEQKKLQKRKAREREVQAKLRERREAKRAAAKDEKKDQQERDAILRVMRERLALEQWANQVGDQIPEKIREQILHNIEILKALEEEYSNELMEKLQLQGKLKEAGHETLAEMMGALQEEAKDKAVERELEEVVDASLGLGFGFGGGAEYSISVSAVPAPDAEDIQEVVVEEVSEENS